MHISWSRELCCEIKLSAPLYLPLLSRKQHRSVADVTALIEISPFPSRVAIFAFLSNSSCLSALSCCHSEGFLRGCSRMLPARTGLSEMGSSTHGWSSALGTSCQDQALLFLISTFAAESGFIPVCFFFQKWLAVCSAVYPASRACSHTKARCCQHKATQRAVLSFPLGLSKEHTVSPRHGWRLPPPGCRRPRQLLLRDTRWVGFLSNRPPAEPQLLVLSAVGKMKMWPLVNFLGQHHLTHAATGRCSQGMQLGY